MSAIGITDTEFEQDLRWLFESVTNYLDVLTRILTLSEVSVPYTPKHILGRFAPYHFAGRLMVLLDFVRGQKTIDRRYIEEVMCDYARMMTINVAAYVAELDNDDDDDDDDDDSSDPIQLAYESVKRLVPHASAVLILGAYAYARVREGRDLDDFDMDVLTGLDAAAAQRAGIGIKKRDANSNSYISADIAGYLNRIRKEDSE